MNDTTMVGPWYPTLASNDTALNSSNYAIGTPTINQTLYSNATVTKNSTDSATATEETTELEETRFTNKNQITFKSSGSTTSISVAIVLCVSKLLI